MSFRVIPTPRLARRRNLALKLKELRDSSSPAAPRNDSRDEFFNKPAKPEESRCPLRDLQIRFGLAPPMFTSIITPHHHGVAILFLSTTSWLYKNNSFVFMYLLALKLMGKPLSFVFNNLLASFGTLGDVLEDALSASRQPAQLILPIVRRMTQALYTPQEQTLRVPWWRAKPAIAVTAGQAQKAPVDALELSTLRVVCQVR